MGRLYLYIVDIKFSRDIMNWRCHDIKFIYLQDIFKLYTFEVVPAGCLILLDSFVLF